METRIGYKVVYVKKRWFRKPKLYSINYIDPYNIHGFKDRDLVDACVEYKIDKFVEPKENCGPLAVFMCLSLAILFADYSSYVKIYECEFEEYPNKLEPLHTKIYKEDKFGDPYSNFLFTTRYYKSF